MSHAPALAIHELTFRWSSESDWELRIPELIIDPGERIFLYGPSGSGKSTLLGLIAGIMPVNTGQIAIKGESISQLSASQRDRFRANHLGMIFQLFNLIPYLSVIENIVLACAYAEERRNRIQGDFAHEANRLLDHLDLDPEERTKPVSELSIGQQQRVAAARALIGSPSLIIADEPTSALDADRQEAFLDLLASECAASEASLLFVSHDRRLSERFDRSIDLRDLVGGSDA